MSVVGMDWLLEFYILATFKVISGWVLICGSTKSWQLYSTAPLGNEATDNMIQDPTQAHYPDTEPTSLASLIMPSAWLGGNKYTFLSH